MKQFHFISLFILTVSQSTFGQHLDNSNSTHLCHGKSGCLETRQLTNLGYTSPKGMDIAFKLFTVDNRNNSIDFTYNSTAEQIKNSTFNNMKHTIFIIHGYMGSFSEKNWMGILKNKILDNKSQSYNVICVDWWKGALFFTYGGAVNNVLIVGDALAAFIKKLVDFTNTRYSKVHLIGHSLGSHVAGHAGSQIQNPKIARITGLDPAGPLFRQDSNRLDASDAKYVEILHTDGAESILEGYGIPQSIGLVDFYPNNGTNQPSCSDEMMEKAGENGTILGWTQTLACDHKLAHRLMRVLPVDLPVKCQFVGIQCSDYSNYVNGLCHDCGENNEKCAILSLFGFSDPKIRFYYKHQSKILKAGNNYYFKTGPEPPYCLYSFVLEIFFSEVFNEKFTVTVYGMETLVNITTKPEMVSGPFTIKFELPKPLGAIKKAVLKSHKPYPFLPVSGVRLYFLNNIDPAIREEWSADMSVTMDTENGSRLTAYPSED